jgi:hypothetical protein
MSKPRGGKRPGAGRPVDATKPRCPCGANSLRRAQGMYFNCCKRAGVLPFVWKRLQVPPKE